MIVIPLILLLLFLPAVQQAKEAARRSQNKNNLKQIGLAFSNYHDTYNTLPPGGIFGADNTAYHGWMMSILPYMECSPLYNSIDMSFPWNHPRNALLLQGRGYSSYWCAYSYPQWTTDGWPVAHYAGNPDLLYRNSSVSFDEVEDLGHTWIVSEISDGFTPWSYPYNWRALGSDLKGGPDHYGHTGNQSHFLSLDGSVRFIADEQVPTFLSLTENNSRDLREHRGEPTRQQTSQPLVRFETTTSAPELKPEIGDSKTSYDRSRQ